MYMIIYNGYCAEMQERVKDLDDPSSEMPAVLNLTGEGKVEAEFNAYPMFDGFIRDESVENLAGALDSEQHLFRPVQLTRIPDKVDDFIGVVRALRV